MNFPFDLWLEFEHYADPYPGRDDHPLCDFCNAAFSLDGMRYAINIWTFAFVEHARRLDDGMPRDTPADYLLPPDLLVERLDRMTISLSIQDLIEKGRIPVAWRAPPDE